MLAKEPETYIWKCRLAVQECEINVLVIAIFSHTLLKNNIISDPKDKSNNADVNVYFFVSQLF